MKTLPTFEEFDSLSEIAIMAFWNQKEECLNRLEFTNLNDGERYAVARHTMQNKTITLDHGAVVNGENLSLEDAEIHYFESYSEALAKFVFLQIVGIGSQ